VTPHSPKQVQQQARRFRVNHQIRLREIRLIDQDGNQVGIVATDDARRMAEEAGLDLVEVSPNANPPVCRILDWGKFQYEQRKKQKGGHKSAASQLKELRVRPTIDPHDLEYRLTSGRRFLENGHKVLVVCMFRGRQLEHKELGLNVMQKVASSLADISKIETPPKLLGRRMTMLLGHK
jgi:translation initiation factor IF-3